MQVSYSGHSSYGANEIDGNQSDGNCWKANCSRSRFPIVLATYPKYNSHKEERKKVKDPIFKYLH